MIKVFGLKNCDTCCNAMKWLNNSGLMHEFHDVRDDGINAEDVSRWTKAVGWETLLNRRGTTWRNLSEDAKADVNESGAMELMLDYPALIKRPVFEAGDDVIVGFKDDQKAALKGGG